MLITKVLVMSEDYEELLKPRDVAKIFNITVKTLWEWQRKGIIKAVKLPTGKLRYPKSEVKRVWKSLKVAESRGSKGLIGVPPKALNKKLRGKD
ncbi:MAG: helix-turn-helix domain-containing protein [Candidatus Freyarchaeota archaeon]|nr:helix-turn-helix domain-containing protein [Candidatus Jordarchaeia archaeon]